jgi:CTP:molybdopterin cytidylyltransferase MocA
MRASVEIALAWLEQGGPRPSTVLITPADTPGLRAEVVAGVIATTGLHPDSIVLPVRGMHRGHPVALPWAIAKEIPRLPLDAGVNALLADHAENIVKIEVEDSGVLSDLDTPEDYQHWIALGHA